MTAANAANATTGADSDRASVTFCRHCRDVIGADGYCSGCGWKPPAPKSPADRFDELLSRGATGFGLLSVAATGLFLAGSPDEHSAQGALTIPAWGWAISAAVSVAAVAVAGGLMSGPAAPGRRAAVWSLLLVAWAATTFLGFRAALTTRAAVVEANRLSAYAEEKYRDLSRLQALADSLGRISGGGKVARLSDVREDARVSEAAALNLRFRAGLRAAAMLCAIAAVAMLLFCLAAEQIWAEHLAPGVGTPGMPATTGTAPN
jgi:hypothetical protein